MAETHDTIDGLLAEFRGYAFGMPPSYHVTMSWADFRMMLDRFDAAHKREVREAVTDCNQLREALRKINSLCGIGVVEISSFEIGSICDNALSSPPRNCDRPECATTKAAQDVWRKEDGGKTAYYEWLLATYKKGDNDGNE